MSLEAGARIGPYEVVCAPGQGGMGEVYRGRDSRLGRDVAIKTLPVTCARDPERNARFGREAQLLAALNHPHIAGIYGVEEDATSRFLILEFIDGVSLADRLAHGPLARDEAVTIAREIADALEAAHEKGIIHRAASTSRHCYALSKRPDTGSMPSTPTYRKQPPSCGFARSI